MSERWDKVSSEVEVMKEKSRIDDLKDEEFMKRKQSQSHTVPFKKTVKSIEPQISLTSN